MFPSFLKWKHWVIISKVCQNKIQWNRLLVDRQFLRSMMILWIKQLLYESRKKIRLPDAIIAATALAHNLIPISSNTADH